MSTYEYVTSLARPVSNLRRWVQDDLSIKTYQSITNSYRDVQIEVSHPDLTNNYIVVLEDIAPYIDIDQTLSDFLSSISPDALPTKEEGNLELNNKTVLHRDGYMSEFDIEPGDITTHPTNPWPESYYKDLLISKSGIDYNTFEKNVLVSINGFLHRTSASEHGVYIVDGNYSKEFKNETNFALTSFEDVAEIEIVNITSDMLFKPHENEKHYHKAHLDLGVSTKGKSVLLSLGGYFHALDNLYKVIGDGLIQIDFNKHPTIQRYYESMGYIDLSSLPYTEVDTNPDQRYTKDLIESEEFIEAFMDLSQTFAILVNTEWLYAEHHPIEVSGLRGTFYCYEEPKYPLNLLRGRIQPYWYHRELDTWVINTNNDLLPNYHFETNDLNDLETVTPQKLPFNRYRSSKPFFIELGRDI